MDINITNCTTLPSMGEGWYDGLLNIIAVVIGAIIGGFFVLEGVKRTQKYQDLKMQKEEQKNVYTEFMIFVNKLILSLNNPELQEDLLRENFNEDFPTIIAKIRIINPQLSEHIDKILDKHSLEYKESQIGSWKNIIKDFRNEIIPIMQKEINENK